MSRSNPFAMHYQSVWHERAGRRELPMWLRVAALAYGAHHANGHANFAPGDIAVALGTPERPLDKHNVQRAIRAAVKLEWLTAESGSTCLVVPSHAIAGGLGSATKPCPVHHKPRTVGQKLTHPSVQGGSSEDHPVGHQMPTLEPLTSGDVTALYDSSLDLFATRAEEAS